jgi:hypothetical protein
MGGKWMACVRKTDGCKELLYGYPNAAGEAVFFAAINHRFVFYADWHGLC